MNCQEFWNTMPDEGTAHPHLAECPACTARVGRQKELFAGLLALATQMDRVQTPERVETQLLAEFRARTGSAAVLARPRWGPTLAWAAVMAAMVAAGVFVVYGLRPQPMLSPGRAIEVSALNPSAGIEGFRISEDGFVALPGAPQLDPGEDLDLVRVELPRSAMMQIGIEVTPDRAAEPVQAEVMLGSDGLARSVRFLEPTGSD